MNGTFSSLLMLLAIAVVLVWLFRRIKLPAILAYLVAGIIAGPEVMGWIKDPDDYHLVAELGIVFLLFSLGLEFSLPKMMAMRRWVFGLALRRLLVRCLSLCSSGFCGWVSGRLRWLLPELWRCRQPLWLLSS